MPATAAWLSSRRGFALATLCLLLVTGLAYLRLRNAAFAWDDAALVADNRLTGSLANVGTFFQVDLWSTTRLPAPPSGYHRPLFLLSLAVDQALFGLSARMHHLDSLAWHLGTVGMLLALLRRLLPPQPALMGAAFFALHPIQSEAVALIAARNDSMAAFFVLATLYLLLDERPGRISLILGALGALGALLSKESAVLLPLLLWVLDTARGGSARIRGWTRYLCLGLAMASWGGIRLWAGIGADALPSAGNLSQVGVHLHKLIGLYGSLLVWPWPLSPARHIHYLPSIGHTLPGFLVLAGLLCLGLGFGRRRLVGAGIAMAILTFLPTLAATLDKGLLGERYLYLPMAGLALVVGAVTTHARRSLLVALPVAILCLVGLWIRLPAWNSSEALWRAAHAEAPTPFTAGGLGWYVNHEGRPEEALPLLVEAVGGEPPYLDACPLMLTVALQLQRSEEAVRLGRWGLDARGCPPSPLYLEPYALALAGTGRWEEALAVVERPEISHSTQTSQVVWAAGMLRQGNADVILQLSRTWKGSVPIGTLVARLFRLAGESDLAERVTRWQAATDAKKAPAPAQ